MASSIYFDFLGSVWDNLAEKDRNRFGELWRGVEQVLTAAYQRYAENKLNIAVEDLQPYTTERWLPYSFSTDNLIERAASIISTQDLSLGINLSDRYLLRMRIDGTKEFEVDVRGVDPTRTRIDEIITKLNLYAGFPFATAIFNNAVIKLTSRTVGVRSSIEVLVPSNPDANGCEFVLGLDPLDLPLSFPEYRYSYSMPYSRVSEIPDMQDAIRSENYTSRLVQETDYRIESGDIISFKEIPPAKLWAPRTQVNDEIPWATYGYLTEIYQENSPRYVGIIQGLWFAFWNGPKPSNVKIALYLLFGLPTAKGPGAVVSVTSETILILGDNGTEYVFTIPSGLTSLVAPGDRVDTFQPLVDGIEVYDKINYPGFLEKEVGREGISQFLTENASRGFGDTDETKALTMLEEYTFLPQISVDTFIFEDINLRNVRAFLDAFKPLNKTYLFQIIIGAFKDILGLEDRIGIDFDVELTSNLDANETTYLNSSLLTNYETVEQEALNLDPHGIILDELVEVEVRAAGILIDSFTV